VAVAGIIGGGSRPLPAGRSQFARMGKNISVIRDRKTLKSQCITLFILK